MTELNIPQYGSRCCGIVLEMPGPVGHKSLWDTRLVGLGIRWFKYFTRLYSYDHPIFKSEKHRQVGVRRYEGYHFTFYSSDPIRTRVNLQGNGMINEWRDRKWHCLPKPTGCERKCGYSRSTSRIPILNPICFNSRWSNLHDSWCKECRVWEEDSVANRVTSFNVFKTAWYSSRWGAVNFPVTGHVLAWESRSQKRPLSCAVSMEWAIVRTYIGRIPTTISSFMSRNLVMEYTTLTLIHTPHLRGPNHQTA